ncbi:MAG: DNA polymerase III, subunit gamma and tau [Epulopiscium sp. Nele67-Bin004]|nr:MAG: DNA polymerase III, subunit gamma and tau [Epulopiscium sp. Nele67-Bin004]
MSYLALYRKYRPQQFDEVVGQQHIIRTLTNQIKTGRIAHAYLFTGSRGTGKTTVAKIFAREVNGEHASSINIIEIDAASHNGVDNIREINEEVRYTPAVGKYKIYIIDEVHMLSMGAFNAMLKTLEEPPAHVIFILATTDPQKIPVTILSRCQRFDFRRINSEDINDCLRQYMNLEQVDIDDEALRYIARIADGGMRDALSVLEQCVAFFMDERITLDNVLSLMGAVDNKFLFDMLDACLAGDAISAINICDEINKQGRSIRQFTNDLLTHTRNLLVAQATGGATLDYSVEYVERLVLQSSKFDKQTLMRYITIFSELDNDLKISSMPKVLLEVAILKMCIPSSDLSQQSIYDKIVSLEAQFEKIKAGGVAVIQPTVSPTIKQEVKPQPIPEMSSEVANLWNKIIASLSPFGKMGFTNCRLEIKEDNWFIVYQKGGEALAQSRIEELKKAIFDIVGKEIIPKLIANGEQVVETNDIEEIQKAIKIPIKTT